MNYVGKSVGSVTSRTVVEATTNYASEMHAHFYAYYDINTRRIGIRPYLYALTNVTANWASRVNLPEQLTIKLYDDVYKENMIASYTFDTDVTDADWSYASSANSYMCIWDFSTAAYSDCWPWFGSDYGTGFEYKDYIFYTVTGISPTSGQEEVWNAGTYLYFPQLIEETKLDMLTSVSGKTIRNDDPVAHMVMTVDDSYGWFDKIEIAVTPYNSQSDFVLDYTTICDTFNGVTSIDWYSEPIPTDRLAIIYNLMEGTVGETRLIYYHIRATFLDGTTVSDYDTAYFYIAAKDIEIEGTVYDINATTVALTGDSNKLIKYHSTARCELSATGGTFTDAKVTNNNNTYSFTSYASLSNVEANIFRFSCKSDITGSTLTTTVTNPMIQYIKPTCNVDEVLGPTADAGNISFSIRGNFFYGSFGAQVNSITVKCWYKTTEDTEWTSVVVPAAKVWTYESNTWKASYVIEGLDYTRSYFVQFSVADKLESAITPAQKIVARPIFDWSKNDFNINVPTTIMNMPIGQNTLLYEATGNKKLTNGGWNYLNENISTTANGIVLVMSHPKHSNYYITHFIPKYIALLDTTNGAVVGVPLQADTGWTGYEGNAMIQYVKFLDNRFAGAGACIDGSTTLYDDSGYYLRYVIGV